jgi:hypothetical protein
MPVNCLIILNLSFKLAPDLMFGPVTFGAAPKNINYFFNLAATIFFEFS